MRPRRGRDPAGVGPVPVIVVEVRRAALAPPEVTEADHHGRPSFRVHGKIVHEGSS